MNASHDDFPALLAEALDVADDNAYDVGQAAKQLGVTATQLLKLIKHAPAALARLNASREQVGLRRLR